MSEERTRDVVINQWTGNDASSQAPEVAAVIYIPLVPIGAYGGRIQFGTPNAVVLKDGPKGKRGVITTDKDGNIDLSKFDVPGDVMIIMQIESTSSGRWEFYLGPKGDDPYMALGIASHSTSDPQFKPMFGKPSYPPEFSGPVLFNGNQMMIFIDVDDINTPYYYQIQLKDTTTGETVYLDPEIKNRGTD